jgi:tRNA A-37 threonylcarbamoyl transferase component Bud32
MPRTVDLAALERELARAIDPLYDRVTAPQLDELVLHSRDQLLRFESRVSLDAEAVALVNDRLATNAAFVAVIERGDWLSPSRCPGADQVHIEVRRLAGARPPGVQILANAACITDGESSFTTWNLKAAGLWLALALLLSRPFVRGWGRVEVNVKLPDQTRALFSISLTRKARKVKSRSESESGDSGGRFNQKLRALGRKERPLRRSGRTTFGWVPARRAEYYVTVRGPLFHSISEELIGDFLEERTVRVARGRTASVSFDLSPKDCPVEIMVYHGSQVLNGAQIAKRGDPRSLRFTSNGGAFLYLPKGRHTLVAGARDRAAEREIQIDSFEPKPVVIDLAAESGLVFQGCEAAVTPFLEGNFEATAMALREVGQDRLATLMQARAHESRGELEAASRLLEQAGQVTQAADMLARSGSAESASLYEEAGEFGRAAEIHQASGDLLAAARAWESAFEYDNAIDCYRQLGDVGQVLALLEKSGQYFEAGQLSVEEGEVGRAIQNLQQVESRHPHYGDACRMLGELLAEQGNRDFALEKLDEARTVSGLESIRIELRERYGRMLEDADRIADAIEVLSSVRREDIHYKDVDQRITELKQRLTEMDAQGGRTATRVAGDGATAAGGSETAIEERYEILGQIGAGGMGVVFKARDKQLGRMVALKRLPENLSQHPAAVKFFEREARSAAALNHPNIVTVYDAGRANGQYFITMELLEGTPLDAIARKHGALPPLVVAQLGVQIATGLHFAHRNKIIHRDIKPANLFLTRDKIVKIMDFGLAKMVEEARKGATVIGGTPYYLAPEQAAGEDVDHRADLYALGITLYQLASGGLPFTEGDVAHHHRHTPPPDPRELDASIPPPLAELILRLIEKRPEDRIQKAADVVRVLQAFMDRAASPGA